MPHKNPEEAQAYFKRYNAARPGSFYQEAKRDAAKWLRVLASRKKSCETRRATARSSPSAWIMYNLKRTAGRCKRDGIPFDLTLKDVRVVETCPITGERIDYGSRGHQTNGPSFDRITPNLGYVAGNVRIISRYANLVRQNCMDPAIFYALARDAEEIQRCRKI